MKSLLVIAIFLFFQAALVLGRVKLQNQHLSDTIEKHINAISVCNQPCPSVYVGEFCKGKIDYSFCPEYGAKFGITVLDGLAETAYNSVIALAKEGVSNATGINSDCENAIKNFICWSIFRECSEGQTTHLFNYPCESACTNVAKACNSDDVVSCNTYPRDSCTKHGAAGTISPNWIVAVFSFVLFGIQVFRFLL